MVENITKSRVLASAALTLAMIVNSVLQIVNDNFMLAMFIYFILSLMVYDVLVELYGVSFPITIFKVKINRETAELLSSFTFMFIIILIFINVLFKVKGVPLIMLTTLVIILGIVLKKIVLKISYYLVSVAEKRKYLYSLYLVILPFAIIGMTYVLYAVFNFVYKILV